MQNFLYKIFHIYIMNANGMQFYKALSAGFSIFVCFNALVILLILYRFSHVLFVYQISLIVLYMYIYLYIQKNCFNTVNIFLNHTRQLKLPIIVLYISLGLFNKRLLRMIHK